MDIDVFVVVYLDVVIELRLRKVDVVTEVCFVKFCHVFQFVKMLGPL